MHFMGLSKAIKYFGSQVALAKAIRVSQQMISQWLTRNDKIPDKQALKIFVATRGSIPLHDLMADADEFIQIINSVYILQKYPEVCLPIHEIKILNPVCPIYPGENILLDMKNKSSSHPILVDENNALITCVCRINACIHQGEKSIFVHRVNLKDVISNRVSIDHLLALLPHSERIAIGLAIEAVLGNRQGKRNQLPVSYPEVNRSLETREIAAKCSGFMSESTYRKAKFIVKNGIPALIKAMDENLIKISKAKSIAELPREQQFKDLFTFIKQDCNYKNGIMEKIHE